MPRQTEQSKMMRFKVPHILQDFQKTVNESQEIE